MTIMIMTRILKCKQTLENNLEFVYYKYIYIVFLRTNEFFRRSLNGIWK